MRPLHTLVRTNSRATVPHTNWNRGAHYKERWTEKECWMCVLGLLAIHAAQSDSHQQACTDANFQQVLAQATKLIGRRPTYQCARTVFDQICGKCKHDFTCYVAEGKRIGSQTPSCKLSNQYIETEVKVMDESNLFDMTSVTTTTSFTLS